MKMILKKSALFIAVAGMLYGCNPESLTDMNVPEHEVDEVVPEFMFTGAILDMPEWNYSMMAQGVQFFSTYKEVPAIGDKYYSFNSTESPFEEFYTEKLNRLYQIRKALEAEQEEGIDNTNQLALVRILRVYFFHQLTDVTGDIPYSQAMLGEEGTLSPEYDTQETIYRDMFKELDEAAASLDPAKPNFGNGDLLYQGDVAKWKKFAYTLMLRLGMRLTKADETLAQEWVQKAIAGGVMTEENDIAYIQYSNTPGAINEKIQGWINGNYNTPGGDNVEGGKYAATFINYMKETRDPRLPVMSVVWEPNGDGTYTANNDIDVQRGMVSGSLNTRPTDFDTYSEPSPLILNLAAPIVILGPAESYLLLAEAAIRGWYSGMSAEEAYNKGVEMGMKQWSLWPDRAPSSGIISDAQIQEYLDNNPFLTGGTFEEQFGQINTQKWVCLFGDDYENFSNWRRTGYPEIMPVNYPGNVTGGQMFRRMYPPIDENLTNRENYLEALERQGFEEFTNDNLTTRVWWDVEE